MDNAEAWGVAETAVSAARAGRPTVLVIEGDAGLGKTRLLRLLTRALGDFEVHRAYGEPDAPDIAFRTLRELTAATGVAEPTGPFQAVSELLALVDAGVAQTVRAGNATRYQTQLGSANDPGIRLDSDLMRLAAGGSARPGPRPV